MPFFLRVQKMRSKLPRPIYVGLEIFFSRAPMNPLWSQHVLNWFMPPKGLASSLPVPSFDRPLLITFFSTQPEVVSRLLNNIHRHLIINCVATKSADGFYWGGGNSRFTSTGQSEWRHRDLRSSSCSVRKSLILIYLFIFIAQPITASIPPLVIIIFQGQIFRVDPSSF